MNEQHPILLFAIVALAVAVPFSTAQAQQLSESRLAQLLKRFPEADLNGDGKLTAEEFQAARQQSQRDDQPNARQVAAARAIPTFDPGWEKDEFPSHAVSLKSPGKRSSNIPSPVLQTKTRMASAIIWSSRSGLNDGFRLRLTGYDGHVVSLLNHAIRSSLYSTAP